MGYMLIRACTLNRPNLVIMLVSIYLAGIMYYEREITNVNEVVNFCD